jgi:hypothetical protein
MCGIFKFRGLGIASFFCIMPGVLLLFSNPLKDDFFAYGIHSFDYFLLLYAEVLHNDFVSTNIINFCSYLLICHQDSFPLTLFHYL